jgi:hypothetical protein
MNISSFLSLPNLDDKKLNSEIDKGSDKSTRKSKIRSGRGRADYIIKRLSIRDFAPTQNFLFYHHLLDYF